MQTQQPQQNRVRRTVNDLVMAEMFLLQATIESATAIGDGFNALGKQMSSDAENQKDWGAISQVIRHTADEVLEPYTSRYQYFRKMISSDS